MTNSPNLNLPYLLAAQSQKHVTHNEALRILDAFVQLTMLSRSLVTPPATPAEGDRYVVPASATGIWASQTGKIAAYLDATWMYYAPKEGWLTWIADENVALAYDGAAWVGFSGGGGGVTAQGALTGLGNDDHLQYHTNARGDARYTPINPATLGVNATADATNKFAVGSAASLFNHVGTGGHQIKVNKAAAADTASFLFQTAFSGRAEIGLTGDDDFHFKVSPNGTTFNEAILINKTTGAVTFPNTTLAGEANTASNVGTAGVGLFKQKTGVNLELKKVNVGSTKLSITDDTVNSEVDFDVVEANLTLANIGGTIDLGGAKASGTVAAARMPAHTGDVTSTAGSVALTIAANAVTNAKSAQMAAHTFKGNNGAAAANPLDLTATQLTAELNAMVGANGTVAGTKGLVPAPAATDNTKFLRGDGTYAAIAGGGDALIANPLSQFAATTSAQLAGVISDETGTGALVFATSPTLVTPVLGTPASGTLTSCTGLPVSTGLAGLGTGVAAFLATPTSANLAAALTDETGTGANVFATSPTLVTPVLGTATATKITFAAGTATVAPQVFTTGANLTTAAAGSKEFDGVCYYATAAASSRQVECTEQIMALTAAYTLTAATTAQKLFNASTNGQLTVQTGVSYFFECDFSLSVLSATSGSFGFALGGTAVLASQAWHANAMKVAALATGGAPNLTFNTAANAALVPANVNTLGSVTIRGIVRVTTTGTLIPQVSLGVAAAAIVGANSYFRICPVGNATVAAVGNWS
jgi:hypothetical protein